MRRRWIVDASNVVGSRPDGWWRDRPRALQRLLDEIARWRAESGGVEGARRFLDRIADIAVRRSDRSVLASFGVDEATLLGRGGEARVFALDDDRVLRLPHGPVDPIDMNDRLRFLQAIGAGHADVAFAVPEVLETRTVHDRTVIVERRLPGKNALECLGEPGTERRGLVRSHLDATATIARLPCPTTDFGEVWGQGAIRDATFLDWATARLAASLAIAGEAYSHLDPFTLSLDLETALGSTETPVLVHLDAFLGNMLAVNSEITAVIDFGPMTIGGPLGLDPAIAVAYLAPEITPTATDADRAEAIAWADEHGIAPAIGPAERWIAAYWTGAPDDEDLQAWCRRILLRPGHDPMVTVAH